MSREKEVRFQTSGKRVGPYLFGRTIGSGTTGRVFSAMHSQSKQRAAIKVIKKTNQIDLRKLQREISILRLLDHPCVTRLYDVFESKNHIYVVMELVEGGELFERVVRERRLQRSEALDIFQQVVEATAYFHHYGIVHRDLKPENILLGGPGKNCVKIADFGFATARRDDSLTTSCGSPHYACPEVCASGEYDGALADAWSLGVLLYVLITGDFPFNDRSYGALFQRIQIGEYDMPKFVDEDVADLISKLLTVDPRRRLRVEQVLDHPVYASVACRSVSGRPQTGLRGMSTDASTQDAFTPDASTSTRSCSIAARGSASSSTTMPEFGAEGAAMNPPPLDIKMANATRSRAYSFDPKPVPPAELDGKSLQELVYLGWASNTRAVADMLTGKQQGVSRSIFAAYAKLSSKQKRVLPIASPVTPKPMSLPPGARAPTPLNLPSAGASGGSSAIPENQVAMDVDTPPLRPRTFMRGVPAPPALSALDGAAPQGYRAEFETPKKRKSQMDKSTSESGKGAARSRKHENSRVLNPRPTKNQRSLSSGFLDRTRDKMTQNSDAKDDGCQIQ